MSEKPSVPKAQMNTSNLQMLCGRRITTYLTYIPQTEYQGVTIYFCTESCLNAFLADPERFSCAHSKNASNYP